MRLGFRVKCLSDIVLLATSNTEGNIKQLDYIPGSNFLGIVARNYDKFKDSFRVFHSGDVKFLDGHILIDNKLSYKIPLSFHHKKLDKNSIFNYHLLSKDELKELGQLKQIRNGYINSEFSKDNLDYTFRQKSAYDKEKRRSKDSQMYGYRAIKKGYEFYFEIDINDELDKGDIKLIKESIMGIKKVGRSKTAEYGLVEIIEDNIKEDLEVSSNDICYIYSKSRLALFDDEGNPTLNLKYLFDGLKDENIDYEKSQLRFSSYTPFNFKRGRDYERVFVEKGSVIVLKGIKRDKIPKFIGGYLSEGFGEILVNPKFLFEKKFELKDFSKKSDSNTSSITYDLTKYLKSKEDRKNRELELLKKADEFIKHNLSVYKNISNSQWGHILTLNSIDEVKEYISKGVKKWNDNQIKTLFEIKNLDMDFIKAIALRMLKVKK